MNIGRVAAIAAKIFEAERSVIIAAHVPEAAKGF